MSQDTYITAGVTSSFSYKPAKGNNSITVYIRIDNYQEITDVI